ncbi:MAG: glycine--tRNA ligase subunit beta [Nitrospinota bacterium]
MSKELLLEIGTEEIPSVYLNPAINKFEELSKQLFKDNRISCGQIKVFGSPRRLVLWVENLSERQDRLIEKVIGPPKRVAFDDKGLPTQAAIGFAKNQRVRIEDLKIEKTEKGEYLCAVKENIGELTKRLLPDILTKMIFSIPFPKYMKWGMGIVKFVRPIHWVLALYNGEVIKFELDGIKSSNKSFGHRFLSPKGFVVKDFDSYVKKSKENYIIFNHIERREIIIKRAQELAGEVGGYLNEDSELLDAVTHLVEYPFPILGEFEKEYLDLPKEILISVMKKHQRYLPIINSNGRLLPNFIAVSNNKVVNPVVMKAGYERVLKARFSDARFFYEEDRKRPFQDYTEKLRSVIFQDKLGSYYEKIERIRFLTSYLADKIDKSSNEIAGRAAFLCKADLATKMVYEFPDLQGVMGREYAILSGEKPEVASAIYEHYLPKFAGDRLPNTHSGDIVSIADKMDTIISCFGIGLIPTGSQDPYALRRQTLAIANIILDKGYQISLIDLINKGIEILGQKIERDRVGVRDEILDFFKSRIKNQQVSDGFSYDIIDAVFSVNFDDILDSFKRVGALSELKSLPYFEPVIISFKRVAHIVKEAYRMQVNKGSEKSEVFKDNNPDPALFKEDAERELYNNFNKIKNDVEKLIKEKRYLDIMKKISEIRDSVDRFFNEVMVMVDDKLLRDNRLILLSNISEIFTEIADFTKIVVLK